jgi:FSR family fosmidomycin resistance protein-like MFS transporter
MAHYPAVQAPPQRDFGSLLPSVIVSRVRTVAQLDSPPTRPIDYPRVALLSLGHLTNDMYGNVISSLTPYLVIRGEISTSVAGLVVLVYLIGSSVLQPFIGHASDRSGRRLFAVLGPIWVGIAATCMALIGNTGTILVIAGLGGIGTAAFHPQAASMVDRLSGHRKGWVMSIFSMGGNVGFAIGPLLAAGIATVGMKYSPVILIPGVAVTILLALGAPSVGGNGAETHGESLRSILRGAWRPLSAIVSIIALRGGVQYALLLFLPLYYHAEGLSAQLGSYYAFVLSLAGAAGGLLGGRISDRFGRRRVVVTSLILALPLLLLSLAVRGPLVFPLLALSGSCLLASNSVTVVQGQELLPANTGIASGLTLGLGFGLSGLIGSSLAVLSDHIGVQQAIFLTPFLAPVAALIAFRIPDRSRPRVVT